MCQFLEKHSELAPKIIRFIEQFRVFLAPIDADNRMRERIESEIAGSNKETGKQTQRKMQEKTTSTRQRKKQNFRNNRRSS